MFKILILMDSKCILRKLWSQNSPIFLVKLKLKWYECKAQGCGVIKSLMLRLLVLNLQVIWFSFDDLKPLYVLNKIKNLLAQVCSVPAVGVWAVDCWQLRSGHYSHFSPSSVATFSHRRRAWIKNLFCESWSVQPKT